MEREKAWELQRPWPWNAAVVYGDVLAQAMQQRHTKSRPGNNLALRCPVHGSALSRLQKLV